VVARWCKAGALAADLKPVIARRAAKLKDASLPDDERAQVAANLLGVRHLDATIVPGVAGLFGTSASPELQKRVVEALGSTGDTAAGAGLIVVYQRGPGEVREVGLDQWLTRAD